VAGTGRFTLAARPWLGGRIVITNEDFAAVLARARAGDNEAMARLIKEYEPQALLVARKRLGPVLRRMFDSADLVQSVHRSLLVHMRQNKFSFSGPNDLIALAVDMVKKKAAKKLQRLKREEDILKLHAKVLAMQKPERAAQLAETVRGLLETLTDSDRSFLQLYLDGYSTAGIGRKLECNADSLRVRRSRLFGKLRAAGLEIA
jgi:RNA polymerase sigma-70 factor (ECF subfamily)